MRKPRRLTPAELAGHLLELPRPHPLRTRIPGELLPPEPPPPRIDWAALFGNPNPVEVEVGSGKGLFLVTAATAHPDRNFLGIEIVRKYQLYMTTRLAVRNLPNAKSCCADAKFVLRDCVVPGSVAAVHVYFPDPWWKTKHKKRLLFTPEFAADVLRVLVPGGKLHFASDVADYFAMVSATLAANPGYRLLPPPPEPEPTHDMDYLTNFERKFRKEGRPIYRAEYATTGPG